MRWTGRLVASISDFRAVENMERKGKRNTRQMIHVIA
jgi:hypothetical protein